MKNIKKTPNCGPYILHFCQEAWQSQHMTPSSINKLPNSEFQSRNKLHTIVATNEQKI